MNAKNIAKALRAKVDRWLDHVDNEDIVKTIKENCIITGGAIVSLLQGEKPHDYDVYFKTYDSCLKVANYYADRWNSVLDPNRPHVTVVEDTDATDMLRSESDPSHPNYHRHEGRIELVAKILDRVNPSRDKRISCWVKDGLGVAKEADELGIDDESEYIDVRAAENLALLNSLGVDDDGEVMLTEEEKAKKPKYRPRYFSANAISLADGIQLVIRFYGDVETIHKNYDYEHCTCSWDYKTNAVNLPPRALECIINKELRYVGSKYPLASIIRSRKFINRGWHINAGQYLKMVLQLNELDLKDLTVFKDQLTGVDSAYFNAAIEAIEKRMQADSAFKPDNTYLFTIINNIF